MYKTNIHTYKHTYIHTYMLTSIHTYIRTYKHTNKHTNKHTYIHTYIYGQVRYSNVHIYIYTLFQYMVASIAGNHVEPWSSGIFYLLILNLFLIAFWTKFTYDPDQQIHLMSVHLSFTACRAHLDTFCGHPCSPWSSYDPSSSDHSSSGSCRSCPFWPFCPSSEPFVSHCQVFSER